MSLISTNVTDSNDEWNPFAGARRRTQDARRSRSRSYTLSPKKISDTDESMKIAWRASATIGPIERTVSLSN